MQRAFNKKRTSDLLFAHNYNSFLFRIFAPLTVSNNSFKRLKTGFCIVITTVFNCLPKIFIYSLFLIPE